MAGYTYGTSKRYISLYRKSIEKTIAGVNKNFRQMDFENADVKNEMEEHINNIINYCNQLIYELDSIYLTD
ncbi:hypothetical protein EDD66_103133 [Mobilisporobacter senegalensis]|uniref:Uncharacterized protein n=1 Tax=Mobilisporobacter senegalensis TaxID=1329262 RepID=A0A3N1XSH9_9FIRM|nr:hypothetical protein [Mobilisporobacter senegalensis]ROR29198.1 hypothetical protein EDD66_103133 [Mobilisporobacter senegalensis]